MPADDLDALFGEVSAELGGDDTDLDVQVDEPDLESTDVDEEGDDDLAGDDTDEGVDSDETDNPDDDGTGSDEWNWLDYSDRLVPRTVNGVTEMVTLKEAIEGSMRQADYTQKTQKIAEQEKAAKWAEDVLASFDRDPMGTLEAFAQAYGLLNDEGQTEQRPGFDELDEDIRPWAEAASRAEQRAAELENRMRSLENERIKSEIRAEMDTLAHRFGDSFDRMAVLQVAATKSLGLEDAYWYLMGQRTHQQQSQVSEAERAAAAAAKAEHEKAEAGRAKRKRAASGTSTKSFRASDIPVDDFSDIGELFEQISASTR